MATLETIRTRAGVLISVIIGIALLSFIINPDSLQRASMMFSSKYDAGKIGGKSISYQDYQEKLDYFTTIHKLMANGETPNEQAMEQIREQSWQELIKETVLYKEFEKVGVTISAEELTDLVSGQNPSPIIRSMFTNQEGVFDRGALIRTVQNMDQYPEIKAQWLFAENMVKDNQLVTKYTNLLSKSAVSNSIDVKNAVNSKAASVEFAYLVKPYNFSDTSIRVTVADLKKYYNEHKSAYEQTRSRDMIYVSFPIAPSADDYRVTMDKMLQIEKEFVAVPVADLPLFVNRNSEKQFDDVFHKKGELPLAVDTFAFNAPIGASLPIYQEGESYSMARIADIRNLSDSVRASHILLSSQNVLKVDSLMAALKGGADFAAMAAQYGTDGTAQQGGDLGWFPFRAMVRPFSDSCFYHPKGSIMKVQTRFGIHIVKVTDKSTESKHVQVAIVEQSVTAGKLTSQGLYSQANAIATFPKGDRNKFETYAAEKGLQVQLAERVGLNDKRVANFSNARELIRWAYDAEPGDISGVLDMDNSYFVVAMLTGIREEGVAPLEQVKVDVEMAVRKEKQKEKMIAEFKEAIPAANNSIDNLGEKMNLRPVSVSNPVVFDAAYIPTIMVPELKLVGAVTSAPENIISGPIDGENGVYAFVVTKRIVNDSGDAAAEKLRLQSLAASRANEFYSVLLKKANITDNRGKFF